MADKSVSVFGQYQQIQNQGCGIAFYRCTVFGIAAIHPPCFVHVLCVTLFALLFVNNGLVYIRSSVVDHKALSPWIDNPQSLLPPFKPEVVNCWKFFCLRLVFPNTPGLSLPSGKLSLPVQQSESPSAMHLSPVW